VFMMNATEVMCLVQIFVRAGHTSLMLLRSASKPLVSVSIILDKSETVCQHSTFDFFTANTERGGCGVVIYFRKEGRSLGEVTKYLVYNTRKRQEGGDSAENYFNCTEQVAGVQDTRFQALMPDPLHFLGVTKIHNFISMSDMKYNAIVSTGIEIVNRVEIPKELVPDDAQVEITAKVYHGYNAGKAYQGIDENELKKTRGREYAYDKPDERKQNVVEEEKEGGK